MYNNPFGVPGQGTSLETRTGEVTWGGNERQVLLKGGYIDGTTRFGSSAVLAPGLLMGKVTATGKYKQWDPEATDGTQKIAGIIVNDPSMVDPAGNNVDAYVRMIHQAPLMADSLYIEDAKMVGHNYEYEARKQLSALGCIFDDGVSGVLNEAGTILNADTTLAAAHYNQHITVTGSRTITVPTATAAHAGVEFRLSASGGNITLATGVTGTVSSGDTITIRGRIIAADTVAWFIEGVTS